MAGWGLTDTRSRFHVDISKIVAKRIQLPDGRYVAYQERGASKETAQRSILVVHGFLSSRHAGIPGIRDELLERYGVRLVSYDRPGYGQSDPHPQRSLNTSAQDMVHIADALGLGDKFWVLGYSGGGPHAWAALYYIPQRLAGVVMFAPMGNAYAKHMTNEETKQVWGGLSLRRKFMFMIAHYLPSFLPSILQRNTVDKINRLMKLTRKGVGEKDRALLDQDSFGAAWEKDMRESVRQGTAKPHSEEVILHTNDWGFNLADLLPKSPTPSLYQRMHSLFRGSNLPAFAGPIHIFQGTDDKLVPPAMNDYAKRVLPHIHYHKLEGEGHFSWFCYCDSCHKNLFEILFGEVDHVITSSEPKGYIPPETATTSPLEAEKITTKG
jgi:pimeloyl-ACP methyl ester carboxylesterase